MNSIVVDTDIFVDFLRGFGKSKELFDKIKNEDYLVHFSAITEAELIGGSECSKMERKAEILAILSHFTKIPVTNEIDYSRINEVKINIPY